MPKLRSPTSWTWLLVLFSLSQFAVGFAVGHITSFAPLYLKYLGVPDVDVPRWTGFITSGAFALGIPFLPLWGALADRYTRKLIIVRAFGFYWLSLLLTWLLVNVWGFVLARLLFAFTLGNSGLMMATLAEHAPPRRVAFALSTVNSALLFGAFLGPLVGGPIIGLWGFQTLWLIDALLLTLVVVAMAFGYRDTFVGTDRGPILKMAVDSVFIITRSPRLRWLFPSLFLLYSGSIITFTYVPLIAAQLYRGAEAATGVGIVFGASGFVTMILSPYVGTLADRFGHRRMLLITALVATVIWSLPALTSDFLGFTVLWAVVYGVSASVFALSFTILSQSAASDVRGRVMSFAFLPVNMGGIIGPLLGSLLIPFSVYAIFPAAAVFTALGVGVFVVAMRRAMTPLQAPAISELTNQPST